MIFVPLLHYFKCKNTYSGNEYGLRYRLTAAASCLEDAFNADPERWKNCPDMMDCDPWTPPAPEPEEEAETRNA